MAQTCGAGNRLNMYQRPSSTVSTSSSSSLPTSTPTSGSYSAKGCYTEATNRRALVGKTYYDDAMTIDKCFSACTGFDYFGLEYYRECYCGNDLQSGSRLAESPAECKYPCTGDKTQNCGGDSRLNVYQVAGVASPSASATPTPEDYAFEGCYTEGSESRALTGATYYDNQMTNDKCAVTCRGFTYFGTEYARECYCGNTLQKGSTEASLADCGTRRPGDKTQFVEETTA
ncbi:MAG: hypothetical protein Q9226_003590 [Calogaya cf. arnoldii]